MYQYRLQEGTAGTSRRYIRGEDDGQGVEVYEVSPQALAEELPGWCYPLCSSGAAAIAAVATHPIDVVKTNMQVAASLKVGIEHDRRLLARLDTHVCSLARENDSRRWRSCGSCGGQTARSAGGWGRER